MWQNYINLDMKIAFVRDDFTQLLFMVKLLGIKALNWNEHGGAVIEMEITFIMWTRQGRVQDLSLGERETDF